MNKTVLLLLLAFFVLKIQAQQTKTVECASEKIHAQLMKDDPVYRAKIELNEQLLQTAIQNQQEQKTAHIVYTIPIVVHVVHLGESIGVGTNVSLNTIQQAINGLNERFRNQIGNGTTDIEIQFCLASRDPNGGITSGVNRVNGSSVTNYATGGIANGSSCTLSANEISIKNLSRWPNTQYYNIWIVNNVCDGLWGGFAYYPGASANVDGAIVAYNQFGYDDASLAHELGHGFNLYHTFTGDNNNSTCPTNTTCTIDGDRCCDTPPHKQSDCGSSNPCTAAGIWDNSHYNNMSYCYYSWPNMVSYGRFTPDQKSRMVATLSISPRSDLLTSLGCSGTSSLLDCSNTTILTCGQDYNGTTVGGNSNVSAYSCTNLLESGPERIHKITTSGTGTITATLSNLGANNLDVYILGSCDQLNCLGSVLSNSATYTNAPPGDYFIVVDGFQGASGAYTLNVSCPPVPTLDCSSAIALTCGQIYTGTTIGANSNIADYSCVTWDESGPEVVHTITISSQGTITANLSGLSADLDVFILSSCDPTTCLASGDLTATYSNAQAGTYYVVVEGYQTASSAYTLQVSCPVTVALNCSNAVALTCGQSYSGTTVGGNSNVSLFSCIAWNESGPEKVHTVTTTSTGTITAKLTAFSADMDVFILSSCDVNACLAFGDTTATYLNAPPGTYYIVVDGFAAASGTYTLQLTCAGAPVLNCANAIALTCGQSYSGTTVGGNSTVATYNCSIWSETGPEQVHTIVTTSTGTLSATLSAFSADMDVFILNSCDASACLASGDVTATYNNAPPGTYYIIVDGFSGANGTYTLALSCACAVPAAVSVAGGGTACNSQTLTASGGTNGTIYWQGLTSNGTSMTTSGSTQTVTQSGTYYFRAYNACGWGAQGSATVTINSAPTAVTVSGGGTFCGNALLTASGGTGGTIYWQGTNSNGTSSATASTSQTVTSSGTYYFRANNSCGWGTQGSVTVTINSSPTSVSVSGGGTFCNSAVLTASGGTGGTIYWQGTNSNGTSSATASTSQTVTSSGTYYFRANNSCGWGSQGSALITINPTVTAGITISANPSGAICAGIPITFTATINNGGTTPTFQWNNGAVNVGSGVSYTSSSLVNNSGISCILTSNAPCVSAATVASNTITVPVNTAQTGLSIGVTADTLVSPFALQNNWYILGNSSSAGTGTTIVCSSSVNYFVTGADTNGCIAMSDTLYNCSATKTTELAQDFPFHIYPNPTNGLITIDGIGIENGTYTLELKNTLGQLLFTDKISISDHSLSKQIFLEKFANGIYSISIQSEKGALIYKIQKL